MSAPLSQLLAELNAELIESSVTDPEFKGSAVVRKSRGVLLAMPPEQSVLERDMIARALLGHAFGVPVSPLPEPYQLTELERDEDEDPA